MNALLSKQTSSRFELMLCLFWSSILSGFAYFHASRNKAISFFGLNQPLVLSRHSLLERCQFAFLKKACVKTSGVIRSIFISIFKCTAIITGKQHLLKDISIISCSRVSGREEEFVNILLDPTISIISLDSINCSGLTCQILNKST